MKKLLIKLAIVACVLFAGLITTILIPVERAPSSQSLDFDTLEFAQNSSLFLEEFFTATDGENLFFRKLKGSSKTIIVLLHGSGSEGRYLMPLAEKLNAQIAATIIIPDLRGHGRSTLHKKGDIDYLGQYLDDLNALQAHLRKESPNSMLILGGHSSGGGLALKYGGYNPSAFSGYLLLAPYLGNEAPTIRPSSGGWVQVSIRRYIGLSILNELGITALNSTPVILFNRPDSINDEWQVDSYSYRLNESLAPQSYVTDLQTNTQPIMVLVGANDEAFYADKFEDTISPFAPHADIQIIPDINHLGLPNSNLAVKLISQWVENLST